MLDTDAVGVLVADARNNTQGDGISLESLKEILDNMTKHGWAADNLAFGSGGALLQKLCVTSQPPRHASATCKLIRVAHTILWAS